MLHGRFVHPIKRLEGYSIETHSAYMSLFLPDHDEMDMYDNQEFMVARLEEEVLDVAKQNV